jgi:uncharacterized protein
MTKNAIQSRPTRAAPAELQPLLAKAREQLAVEEFWLFGSRARGDHRPDSDWDVLAVLDDTSCDAELDSLVSWQIARSADIASTFLTVRKADFLDIWGVPNSLGYILAREGIRLVG